MPTVELRDYQNEAVSKLMLAHQRRVNGTLIAGVGAGKTTILAEWMRQVRTQSPDERTLIVVHRHELVTQIIERLIAHGSIPAADIGMLGGGTVEAKRPITVAMIQSLTAKNVAKLLASGYITNVVIDEAHHAVGDNTYGAMLDGLDKNAPTGVKVLRLGITATPKRHDEKGLDTVFRQAVNRPNSSVIHYNIPTADLIQKGWLCKPVRLLHQTGVDTNEVRTNSQGDFSQKGLSEKLNASNWVEKTQQAYHKHAKAVGKTIVFMPTVASSIALAQALQADGVRAGHVDGTTDAGERKTIVDAYRKGEIDVLINVAVFTEGFDVPDTRCVILARPTRSQPAYEQMVGRGLRLAEGKEYALIIEMKVNDHKLAKASDLFGIMVPCRGCDNEFMHGTAVCPHCGRENRPSVRQMQLAHLSLLPESIQTVASENSWPYYVGADGALSYLDGFGVTYLAVPIGDSGEYTLYRCAKESDSDKAPVARPLGVHRRADIEAQLTRTSKMTTTSPTWQKMLQEEASERQLWMLKKLGAEVTVEALPEQLSKADCVTLIAHYMAVRDVQKALSATPITTL